MSQDIIIKVKNEGAELTSIEFKGRQCLHQSDKTWKSQAPILFPVIGSCFEDSIIIEGIKYPQSHHGFIRDTHFRKFVNEPNYLALRLLSNSDTKKVYPFEFDMEVFYSVFENTLSQTVKVKNVDTVDLPFMIGFHPGFTLLPNTNFEDYSLKFEYEEDNNLVIVAPENQDIFTGNTIKLSVLLLNQGAIVLQDLKSQEVSLYYKEEQIFSFEFNSKFLGIWTRTDTEEKFICLEPWYSIPDRDYKSEFAEKPSIRSISPGGYNSFCYKVSFFK